MNIIKGDLIALVLEGRFDVIVHGCNCMCVMGAGLAGGDWGIVGSIIDKELEGLNHTLVRRE